MDQKQFFTGYDAHLFGHGTHYELYEKLGAHLTEEGCVFDVWAPHAEAVSVVGDFNGWDPDKDPMTKIEEIGVWEAKVPGAVEGQLYKFFITAKDGRRFEKADPFARSAELRPKTASRIADESKIRWTDAAYLKKRNKTDPVDAPVSIYECHIASWKRHPFVNEGVEGSYTYREFAVSIAEYCREMGYTHLELLGIEEYPFDGSWGYQVTGYFAPTARYGTPEDFAWMIDYLHSQGIGIILDWVPAHFPKDSYGLSEFDGEALYEYGDPRKGEHKEWGTKVFDYGRPEVCNFLSASALYWVEKMHLDGLRVDAVASMLYLNYARKDGEWIANKYGGKENLEAVEFFKHINNVIRGRNPGVMMIAEESTAWPGVTHSPDDGGLGFTFKWNMGWMHDFLEYMKLDPYFRGNNHNKMTFSFTYCFSENYVLVLSHDEVVHLKCSMLEKMPGLGGDKFANLRAGYTYMLGHPGKKLLFMGQEFGQRREWSEARELDWFLLAEPEHRQLQSYVGALNRLYRKCPALYAGDRGYQSVEWVNADDANRSIYSFVRWSADGKDDLLFVVNFTPVAYPDYRVGCFVRGRYTLALLSEGPGMGGKGGGRIYISRSLRPRDWQKTDPAGWEEKGFWDPEKTVFTTRKSECDGKPYSIGFPLPAYGAAVFRFRAK